MKIGVDVDDTVIETHEQMYKYADKFEAEELGFSTRHNNWGMVGDRFYIESSYAWPSGLKKVFFNRYFKDIIESSRAREGASQYLQKLSRLGHTIHVITARFMDIPGCDTEAITRQSFIKNNIPFNSMHLHVTDKLTFCLKNGIDIMVEDSLECCRELTEHGILSLLITTPMNCNLDTGDIPRVNDWKEAFEFISRLEKK